MSDNFYGPHPGHGPGPCPIDGTPNCTCKNPDQPEPIHVINSAAFAETSMSSVKATEDIYVPADNGMPGSRVLLYKTGDVIREEDLEMLGLAPARAALTAAPQDKARRGPRERGKASRDKALTAKED